MAGKMDKVDLPTNRSFGLFFSFCFLALGIYFFISNHSTLGKICSGTASGLIIVTLIKPELLSPLNKFWMGLGRLLGLIFGPISLGVIFFGIFTPISLITRLFGRDELKLRWTTQNSYWRKREEVRIESSSFKTQF